MSASFDLERGVTAFLERSGPADVDREVVDAALLEIRGLGQRHGRIRFAGTAPWPPRAPWLQLDAGAVPAAWLALVVLSLLALVAGTVAGSRLLDGRTPSPTTAPAAVIVDPTPGLVPATAAPAVTPGPFASGEVEVNGPCAAMLQLVGTYVVGAGGDGSPPRELGKGDVLYVAEEPTGPWIRRLHRDGNVLVPFDPPGPENVVFPSMLPPSRTGRIVAAPDGSAFAIEEGDLGQAGCGDPIVVLAEGGRERPFPAGPFQLVTDPVWDPTGTVLYAVRRPTVDANGTPYWDADFAYRIAGPGTVLAWNTRSGDVETLPAGCGPCLDLAVSPDGTRLAAWGEDTLWVFEDGAWRPVIDVALPYPGGRVIAGWTDAETILTRDRRLIGTDGTVRAEFPEPCCHGTGFLSVLSPDGTTLAGVTANDDFTSHSLALLDLRDGTTRTVWESGPYLDCSESFRPPTDPACEASPPPTPDPMALSGYAKVAAWAPDGSAVLVAQPFLDSTAMRLWVVPVDGSGPGAALDVTVPDLSAAYGFPNEGSGLAWLPLP